MDLSDEAILEKFRETSDPSLFKSLIRRYQNRLFNVAFRLVGSAEEAEEIVQDTCLRVHQNASRFNKKVSSFAAWIFRITHNACLDHMRSRHRKKVVKFLTFDPQILPDQDSPEMVSEMVDQAPDPSPGPEERLDIDEQSTILARKLGELPESQRTVLVLHDIEGLSYYEIAEVVGTSVGTVRSRLHYGRQRLRELLEPYYSNRPVSPLSR